MKKLSQFMLLVVGIAVILPTLAAEKDPNKNAIKARRAVMTLQSWYAGTLFGMAKGKIEYNADAAKNAAANLNMMANADGSNMWPEGSDNVAYKGDTRAKMEGWTKYDKKYSQALKDATGAMAGAAGNGLEALRANIKALGDSCSGCHDEYRAKDF